jgi:hypothetical protein
MDKYLRQYAERDTAAVKDIPASEPWHQVVVIPVCNESTEILRPLPPASGHSLMILVVNEAESAPHHVSLANQDFAAELHARFRMCWQSAAASGLTLYQDPTSSRDVLLVDRFSDGRKFPPKGGVGHARKTGADLAAYLIHQRRVRSPWIHCTDADACLPHRYFTCSTALSDTSAKDTAALLYPFRHSIAVDQTVVKEGGDEVPDIHPHKIMQVTQLYEYSLRYYVAGLSFAHSPYAFHTIGSTIAVNAAHYAKVRGFPRRQAGEDFYLLNKLAKVGSVLQLSAETDCEPIEIAARLSDRVPFGTGAAVGRIMELEDPAREFLLYHPSVFALLRSWLGSLPAFWQSRSSDIGAILSRGTIANQQGGPSNHSPMDLQVLIGGLEESGAAEALQHAFRQSTDAKQFNRQIHTWFDAFRTIKLIHHLRDHHLPSISFEALVTKLDVNYLLRHESTLPCLHKTLRKNWLDIC